MTTYPASHPVPAKRQGFTLVELLVGMTVIAILAGILSVAVSSAFTRARVFAIQTEMTQIEQALEQFEIEYGFYPPSFRDMTAARMAALLGRISPNHGEGNGSDGGNLETWWTSTGTDLVTAANSDPSAVGSLAGSDLVFWLTQLSKNRQFPISDTVGERQKFFEFKTERLNFSPSGNIANYYQPGRVQTPYIYRDASTYLPSMPDMDNSNDGAYVRTGVTKQQVIDAAFHLDSTVSGTSSGLTVAGSKAIFDAIYFKPDSFQLITFGLDGLSGGPTTCPTPANANPNTISNTCARGADNIVNFGGSGPMKLETVVVERK